MDQLNYDLTKISTVAITAVRPNSWNPKDKNTADYLKVKQSIELNGLRLPIVVRENEGYEIIDGEQRYTACVELGYPNVLIYNEGTLSNRQAKELTIWYQQQVPFNEISLSKVLGDLWTEFGTELQLPYTNLELEQYKELGDFNWDAYNTDKPDEVPEAGMTTITFKATLPQAEVIANAVSKVKRDAACVDGRAYELICASYLGEA